MSQAARFATYMVCAVPLVLTFMASLLVLLAVVTAAITGAQLTWWQILTAVSCPFVAWACAYAFLRLLDWS